MIHFAMDQQALYLSSCKQSAWDTFGEGSSRYYMAEQKEGSGEAEDHSDAKLLDDIADRLHMDYQH